MMPIREAVISKMITGKILFIITKIVEQYRFSDNRAAWIYFLTKVLHGSIVKKSQLQTCNKDFEMPI
jgi:hypothetical protein